MLLRDVETGDVDTYVRMRLADARSAGRWGLVHAFPGVSNAASNGIWRSLGFTLVGEQDVTFADRVLRTKHWQIVPRTSSPEFR